MGIKKIIPLVISLVIAIGFSFFVYKTLLPYIKSTANITLIFLIPAVIAFAVYLFRPIAFTVLVVFIFIGLGLYVFNIGLNNIANFYHECLCGIDSIYFSLISFMQVVIALMYYGVILSVKNLFDRI